MDTQIMKVATRAAIWWDGQNEDSAGWAYSLYRDLGPDEDEEVDSGPIGPSGHPNSQCVEDLRGWTDRDLCINLRLTLPDLAQDIPITIHRQLA